MTKIQQKLNVVRLWGYWAMLHLLRSSWVKISDSLAVYNIRSDVMSLLPSALMIDTARLSEILVQEREGCAMRLDVHQTKVKSCFTCCLVSDIRASARNVSIAAYIWTNTSWNRQEFVLSLTVDLWF